jgi:hypothetical protein
VPFPQTGFLSAEKAGDHQELHRGVVRAEQALQCQMDSGAARLGAAHQIQTMTVATDQEEDLK